MVTTNQVIGYIFLGSETVGAYTESDANLLQRIANQVAGSIANGILLEAERGRVRQLEVLNLEAEIRQSWNGWPYRSVRLSKTIG